MRIDIDLCIQRSTEIIISNLVNINHPATSAVAALGLEIGRAQGQQVCPATAHNKPTVFTYMACIQSSTMHMRPTSHPFPLLPPIKVLRKKCEGWTQTWSPHGTHLSESEVRPERARILDGEVTTQLWLISSPPIFPKEPEMWFFFCAM